MLLDEDDHALVERARSGDFEAFEGLVSRHERRLFALARRLVGPTDAEDVVQTAFLSALEALGRFRGESSFGTWITRIAANAALKVLRGRKGRRSVSLDAGAAEGGDGIPHPEFIADWREDPASTAERGELRRVLDAAIAELGEKHRLVFLLRDVGGLSVEETARELQITPANVKVRLLRARLALRERLTRVFGDPARRYERTHEHEGGSMTSADDLLRAYERRGVEGPR